ncbi:MAG: HDOD domain-containing protein [Desulfatiglans sp.]|jgi:signal transduction histidine kinase|nr:HDOD domain-containing protein [Desulfatiglans sp.]
MDHQSKTELLKRIADGDGFPTLPALVVRMIEIASDDRASAQDLAAIIEKDPGLTTRLLRLAGSAFFSRPVPAASISRAIVFLGFKKVRVMALSLSLRNMFPEGGKKGALDYDYFWKASLYRALIAQDLARFGIGDSLDFEEVFVAALILEIGMLMLHEVSGEETKKKFPGVKISLPELIAWEEKEIGVNHREVGFYILTRWGFPGHLLQTQSLYGAAALEPEQPVLCQVLEVARRMTELVFSDSVELNKFYEKAESLLHLNRETVYNVLMKAFDSVEELGDLLDVAIDAETDLIGLLEKANKALARINNAMESTVEELLDKVRRDHTSLAQMSEKMSRSRREILQNTLDAVAHEIRNPLTAIGGFAERLVTAVGKQGRVGQYAQIITDESARLEQVLRDITEYSRIEEYTLLDIDIIAVVDEILRGMEEENLNKGIRIVRDYPDEPIEVSMDGAGMSRALRRLLMNAVNRVDKTGGQVRVTVKASDTIGQVCISVSDNGRPMEDDFQEALLNADLSAKTFAGGLGLPIVQKIIEAHKGRLEIHVKEGEGNTVKVFLPRL